jgi:hypothetical protein
VDGTGSGSCPVADFGVSGVEPITLYVIPALKQLSMNAYAIVEVKS